MKPTLVFDLDNTLVECGQYYLDVANEFSEYQARRLNCSASFANELQHAIDVEMAKRPGGFRRDRFPTSFAATSYALDAIHGRKPDEVAAIVSFDIGDKVFTAPYTPYDGTFETLKHYTMGGWQLVLLTKGEEEVQRRKIAINGFDKFFKPENIFITLTKSPEYLGSVLQQVDANPNYTWVLGDSVRDDIGPALKLNIGAIEVATGTGKWGYENAQHMADHVVYSIEEIRNIIPQDPRALTATHGKRGGKVVPVAA